MQALHKGRQDSRLDGTCRTLLRRAPNATSIPLSENRHLPFQMHNINNDDGVEACSYFGFILLYDDAVFEDRDNTIPITREMVDDCHSKSDNIDTPRLNINVNLRVFATISPRDKTDTHLLHNKPNTDELTCHFAPASMDLIDFTPLISQGLCNALPTKREDVISRFFETMSDTLTCLAVHNPDTISQLDAVLLDTLVNAGALQKRALLRIVRTAPSLQPK